MNYQCEIGDVKTRFEVHDSDDVTIRLSNAVLDLVVKMLMLADTLIGLRIILFNFCATHPRLWRVWTSLKSTVVIIRTGFIPISAGHMFSDRTPTRKNKIERTIRLQWVECLLPRVQITSDSLTPQRTRINWGKGEIYQQHTYQFNVLNWFP